MEIKASHQVFGGVLHYVEHAAATVNCTMRFSVFVPPKPSGAGLIYLAGLTCTEDNFTTKAGAYKLAAELGLVLVAPDTSPRGEDVADAEGYDIGKGAGFYINAVRSPWAAHYQMESYIAEELRALVTREFATQRLGIFGHSMGGHGALTLAQKYPHYFASCSAFAPICAPTQCAWGEKVFGAYLGDDRTQWAKHDATALMVKPLPYALLIDQGLADNFLASQLHPHLFEEACKKVGQALTLRRHEGYDHGYFFIQSFMEDHLRHHAQILRA